MPSLSIAQKHLMGLAEHHPEKVSAKNRGVLRMSHQELHDFSSTPERGLPHYAPKRRPLLEASR